MISTASREFDHVDRSLQQLLRYIEAHGYRGYDPYDGLNSPILRLVGRLGKYPRIAATQFMKRCPVNLRPVLLVDKGYNPKGLGLFLWGYTKLQHAAYQGQEYSAQIRLLLRLISESRSSGCSGNGWGYNFDWQSRAFYVPKFTPTIVNSAFIGHGLIDLYETTGNRQALDLAIPIKDFILQDLPRTKHQETFCFSYTPIAETPVHNANLLGASLLIRIHQYVNESAVRDAALAALAYSMKRQHEDGSWWYAEPAYQHWIDSFHTGFNLQSIDYFLRHCEATEYAEAFEQGVRFYEENFFLDDGTAKYYHDRVGPIDIHSYAQAIVFFSRLGERYRSLTDRVIRSFIETFQSRTGYFFFQKTLRLTNRIPYMRWSQAWALHALTEYVVNTRAQAESELTPC